MRTEREIRNKINELIEKEQQFQRDSEDEAAEYVCNQIDALLWVIEDTSGGVI